MALSYNEYTANGSQNTYSTPPYLDEAHLEVFLNGVEQSSSTYTVTGTSLVFNDTPTAGTTVRVGRNSNRSARLTDYADASLLTADAMDFDSNQLFYIAQEALDKASETNIGSNTFYSSSSTAPENPKIGDLWYDVGSKYLKIYNGTEWVLAVPTNDTLKYESFINTEANYSYIEVPAVHKEALVFLNGVKLVEASQKGHVLPTHPPEPDDYYIDVANERIYFASLTDDNIVEVVLAVGAHGGGSGDGGSTGDGLSVVDNGDGTFTFTNTNDGTTIVISDGNDGAAAPIPTVTDNGDGTYTIDNGNGDVVTFSDGVTPISGTDYFDGNDGSFVSFIYMKTTSQPTTPTGGTFDGNSETFPTGGWYDVPTATTADIEWVSTTRYTHDSATDTWSNNSWSTPSLFFQKGDDGADGTSVTIKGSLATTDGLSNLPAVPELGDGYVIDGNLWVCISQTLPITAADFQNVGPIAGNDGADAHIHFAYADDNLGNGFTTSYTEGKSWLGIYADNSESSSTTWSHYNWQLIKGADGETITWKGDDLTSHPANPENGWAYYNPDLGKSYIYKDNAWFVMTKDGNTPLKGVDYFDGGFVSFIYKVSTTAPSTPTGGTFNGTAEAQPSGWSDNPTADPEDTEWVSKTKYIQTGENTWQHSGWSAPSVFYQKGADGLHGVDGMVYKGASALPPSNPQLNWAYKDSDDGIIYIYNGSAWEVMVYDGDEGPAGAPGGNGLSVFVSYTDKENNVTGLSDVVAEGSDIITNGTFDSNLSGWTGDHIPSGYSNLFTNGTFDSDLSGFTDIYSAYEWVAWYPNGKAIKKSSHLDETRGLYSLGVTLEEGATYEITGDFMRTAGSTSHGYLGYIYGQNTGDTSGILGDFLTSGGSFSRTFTATNLSGNSATISFWIFADVLGSWDNLSIKRVATVDTSIETYFQQSSGKIERFYGDDTAGILQTISTDIGQKYRVAYEVVNPSGATGHSIKLNGIERDTNTNSGTFSYEFTADSTSTQVGLYTEDNFRGTIDNITVKPLITVSSDGNDTVNGTTWSTTPTADTHWMSQKVAASATEGTWSDPIKIRGANGDAGNAGPAGSGRFFGDYASLGTVWTDAQAVAVIVADAQRSPTLGDVVSLSQWNNRSNETTKMYNGSGTWGVVELHLNGSLLVDGSISADAIATNAIKSIHISADQIKAGHINSTAIRSRHIAADAITADHIEAGALVVGDASVDTLHIKGDAVTLPIVATRNQASLTNTFPENFSYEANINDVAGGSILVTATAWAYANDNDGRVKVQLQEKLGNGAYSNVQEYIAGVRVDSGAEATWELPIVMSYLKRNLTGSAKYRMRFEKVQGNIEITNTQVVALGVKR